MNRIKELREALGLKQLALAKMLDVSQQTISRYEKADRQITVREIARLCEIFACSADYLLGLSSQRAPQISDDDAALVDAYHAADERTRQIVDLALRPYFEKTGSSAFTGEAG